MKKSKFARRLIPYIAVLANCGVASVAQQATDPTGATEPQTVAAPVAPKSNFPTDKAPSPAKITCAGAQLTIVADNSSLGNVLSAVNSCLGLVIDAPEGSSETRVFVNIGPSSAAQVLQSLLSSLDYDYVMKTAESNPNKVQSVVLMSRAKDAKDANAKPEIGRSMNANRRAWMESRSVAAKSVLGRQQDESTTDDSANPLSGSQTDSPAPEKMEPATPPQPTDAAPKPSETPNAEATQPGGAATPSAAPAAVAESAPQPPDTTAPATSPTTTTPADETQTKITSMQQMFEQRKQMVESQSSTPKPQ